MHRLIRCSFMLVAASGVAITTAGGVAVATHQPFAAAPDEKPLFAAMTLEEALAESIRTKKLLIVYPRKQGAGFDEMDRRTWTHPGLRAWLRRHAIVARVDSRDNYGTYAALRRIDPLVAKVMDENLPVVLLFRDGRFERTIPHQRMQDWSDMGLGGKMRPDPKVFCPKPAQMLLALQLHLEGLASTDPAWLAVHELRNPEPPAPPRVFLHEANDGLGEPVSDPAVADAGAVLERVRTAREAAAAGDLHRATGLYTWLWERGPSAAPGFGAARAGALAGEVLGIGARREATRRRFEAVRAELEARQAWWAPEDWWEWTLLNAALGDEGRLLEVIEVLTADPIELPLLTAADRAGLELIVNAAPLLGGTGSDSRDALGFVASESQRIGAATAKGEDAAAVDRLRRRIVLDLACGLYVRSLETGDESGAAAMEAAALRAAPETEARRAMLWAVFLAGLVRPEHVAWLDLPSVREADPALLAAVREASKDR